MPVEIVNNLKCPRAKSSLYQRCPLCGEMHPAIMRGLTTDMETGEVKIAYDKGYSFCNCRNIFFTDYENIEKSVYDIDYSNKYKTENVKQISIFEAEKYYEIFKHYNSSLSSLLEIGSVHDHVLDVFASKNIDVKGFDIIARNSNHDIIVGDFENKVVDERFDVIYASHVFEHFKSPAHALKLCKRMLNENGLLYISMPDTFFIDWETNNGIDWDWHVKEHYILWNMESWIEFCEDNGFKCIHKERGTDLFNQKDGTNFWKQDFKVILTHD